MRPLTVPPATEAETLASLRAQKPALERDNGVQVADSALQTAYALSRQYLSEPQPAAALGLLQRAEQRVARDQREVGRRCGTRLHGHREITGTAGGQCIDF